MKRMPWLLGLPAVLAGCATLSDEECRQAAASPQGWTAVGERDGARGRTPDDRLARHRKACESTHVEPDQTRYMAGWNTGIRRYCTAQTAYDEGVNGNEFRVHLCRPGDDARLLMANWRQGAQIHAWTLQINAVQSEIWNLERELDHKKMCRVEGGDARQQRRASMECGANHRLGMTLRLDQLRQEMTQLHLQRAELQSRPLMQSPVP